jgi:hypothetical protein
MRIRIRWTHIFNLLIQFPIWIGSIACGAIPSLIFYELLDINIPDIVSIILFIIGAIFGGFYLSKWLQPIATMWYLSVFCNTSVSFKEAEELTFLFDGSLNGKWYPFKDLINIPKEYRKKILYEFAERLMGYRFKTNPYYKKQTYNTYSQRTSSENSGKTFTDGNFHRERNNKTATNNENVENIYGDNYLKACSIMGLGLKFTYDELKSKYRELMKQYHPDLFVNSNLEIRNIAENKTREINNAYEYLAKNMEYINKG